MTQCANQATAASCGDGIQVLRVPGELDMATAGSLAARGCAAATHAGCCYTIGAACRFATPAGSAPSSRSPATPTLDQRLPVLRPPATPWRT